MTRPPLFRLLLSLALLLGLLHAARAELPNLPTPRQQTGRPPIDLWAPTRPPMPAASKAGPSTVIYPAQRLPLKFSHARHLQRGTGCVECHEQATVSVSSRDNLLPKEAACARCHAIDHDQPGKRTDGPPAACGACHRGLPANIAELPAPGPALEAQIERSELPAPHLKFNHRQHAEAQIQCERCHGDLRQIDLATRAQLPRMALCLGCHSDGLRRGESAGRRAPTARCPACHIQQGDGTLETRLPSGVLVPSGELRGDDHSLTFSRQHRQVALSEPSYCANCHTQPWCQRCHNGVVKPLDIHGGDYISRHGQDARRNQPDCGSCHRQQTFCLACHERLGVVSHSTLPGSPSPSGFQPASARRFHPEGWASSFGGAASNQHAQEAQRNIRSCTSCHREETCLGCHSTLSDSRVPGGANPHPADWVSSGRCRSLVSRNSRVCLKCHRDGAAALSCN